MYTPKTKCVKTDTNSCRFGFSLRKQPFLLALCRWGRFARNHVCDSTLKIQYWWRKISPESRQKRWFVDGVVTLFYYCLRITDKRPRRSNVNRMNLLQNCKNCWNIFFSWISIWVLLELVHRWTQHFSKIDQEKRKIEEEGETAVFAT